MVKHILHMICVTLLAVSTLGSAQVQQMSPHLEKATAAARAAFEKKQPLKANVQESIDEEAIITITAKLPKEFVDFVRAAAEEQMRQQAALAHRIQKILELDGK